MTSADEQRFMKLIDVVDRLNDLVAILTLRIDDLEVRLDNLRVQYDSHDHPYKSPPVYGRGSM